MGHLSYRGIQNSLILSQKPSMFVYSIGKIYMEITTCFKEYAYIYILDITSVCFTIIKIFFSMLGLMPVSF